MSHQYTLNTDSPDISMTNTPQPTIHRPAMSNSAEENLRYQQELYDYVEWQGSTIQALQERVQKQDDIIHTLHLAVQSVLGGGARPKGTEPKVNNPTEFSGDKAQLEHFISACETKFLAQPSLFREGGEPAKVLWASSFLSGVPKSWWQPIQKAYYTASENHTPLPREFQLFTNFAQSLRDLFGDPNLAKNSMTALESLTQTGTAAEYIAQFEALRQYATYDSEVTEMRLFYKGLRPNLKDKVHGEEYNTLKELQALATKWDIRIQERNAERAIERNQTRSVNPPPTAPRATSVPCQNVQGPTPIRASPTDMPTPPKPNLSTRPALNVRPTPPLRPAIPARPAVAPQSWDGSTPMELDAQGARHITAEEKERRRMGNLCFYCGLPGHTSRNCPSAPTTWRAAAVEIHTEPAPETGKDDAEE